MGCAAADAVFYAEAPLTKESRKRAEGRSGRETVPCGILRQAQKSGRAGALKVRPAASAKDCCQDFRLDGCLGRQNGSDKDFVQGWMGNHQRADGLRRLPG